MGGRDRRAVVVVGPRQVGKTVLLRQCIDDLLDSGWPPANITYFDFSDERLTPAPGSPREIAERVPVSAKTGVPRALFFDEVGLSERWAQWLKQEVDKERARIAVTDSSASLLQRGTRESGLGRWDELRLDPLTYPEFLRLQAQSKESEQDVERRVPDALARFLEVGGFPEHLDATSLVEARRRLRADIAEKAIVRDLLRENVEVTRVKDLFVYLMEDSGSIFDRDARSRLLSRTGDDRPDRRSMEKWLELLLATMLVVRVDPHSAAPTGRLGGRAKPKLYAVDPGLICAFSQQPTPLEDPKTRGQVAEAAVLRALRATTASPISYVRDTRESDFVVDGEWGRAVVEVTAARAANEKLTEVRSRARSVRADRALVVHGGEDGVVTPGACSLRRFLHEPQARLEEATL